MLFIFNVFKKGIYFKCSNNTLIQSDNLLSNNDNFIQLTSKFFNWLIYFRLKHNGVISLISLSNYLIILDIFKVTKFGIYLKLTHKLSILVI